MIHVVIVSPSSSSTSSSNHCIAILLPDGPLWHRSFLLLPNLPPAVFQFLLENDNSGLQAAYLQSSPTPRPLREASTGPRCPNASLYCYCTYKPSPTEDPQKNVQVCSAYVFTRARACGRPPVSEGRPGCIHAEIAIQLGCSSHRRSASLPRKIQKAFCNLFQSAPICPR